MQREFNTATHETITWDVEWVSDCAYSLHYNSGMEYQPKKAQEMLKKHKIICQVLNVTTDYYIYQSMLDKVSNPVLSTDTIWIKQRSDAKRKVTNNPGIDSILALRKAAFDLAAAKSAFLYVFRPGKFAESEISYTLSLNDVPICEMANKASYEVRLLKDGPTTFVAKAGKQETSITINVKAGDKYFLRCELPWSLSPKPRLTEVTREQAEPYFDHTK